MNKDEINDMYREKAIDVFPFINKQRITILEKGYYTKKKSIYRGISYIYDDFNNEYKTLLLGYYYVPEDYIIVFDELDITPGKQDLIDKHVKKGYKLVNECPSLKPVSFGMETPEYQAAFASYNEFKSR